jgi:chromosome segregation ATPase
MDDELTALEQRLATLLAHTRALRAANESLRAELTAARERNRDLAQRVELATARLDALLARIPSE